jgi:C1A family cysteine protease
MVVFTRNLIKIRVHNANASSTWKMGVNQFTDLTEAEFAAVHLTLKVPKNEVEETPEQRMLGSVNEEEDIDWVAEGKVTAVRNQGVCGACYAFSAIHAVESAYLIKTDKYMVLSVQDVLDCSKNYGNFGCNGGWMDSAFKYIKEKGIAKEEDYPYTGRDGNCLSKVKFLSLSTFRDVPGCTGLKNALYDRPVSSSVDATNWGPYSSGILDDCGRNMNHGILVVGVTEDYWKVKNSWGVIWGEKGYIRLARGNTCAICNMPSYPIL